MIKKLRLINWKSFEDATLHIDPLTIIIGANASGKSNLLDALMFLYRIGRGVGVHEAIEGGPGLSELRGGFEWVCLKPNEQFILELTIGGTNENEEYVYRLTIEVLAVVAAHIVSEELSHLSWPEGAEEPIKIELLTTNTTPGSGRIEIKRFISEGEVAGRSDASGIDVTSLVMRNEYEQSVLPILETNFPASEKASQALRKVLKALRSIFVFDPIPSLMRGYSRMSHHLDSDGSNIAGVLAQQISPRKEEIEKILASYVSVLPERDIVRVWAEGVGKFKTDAMLYCEEAWSNSSTEEVDARGMSDGTLRYIAIVTALLTREKGGLMVIDEIDNALHPSRSDQLLKMLKELGKKRDIDVIVTTHNPSLLDAAGPSMVPFITVAHRNDVSGASELKLFEDIETLPKLLAYGSLGKLSADGRIEKALTQADSK
jgi:predicted ATPase